MRKLWILLKIDFRALLAALSFGSSRKKKLSGAAALTLLGALMLLLSGTYCVSGGMALNTIGAIDYLFPLAAALACFASFLFTVFCASGVVFGGKDMDLMLSLPVSAFVVMLAKMLALYLENLAFCVLFLVPAAGVQAYWQMDWSFGYWGAVLIAILVLAFLPTLCSLLIGYAVAFVSGRMRHKALVANIAYFLFIAAIFAGTFWLQTGMQKVAVDRQGLTVFLNQWLSPFMLLWRALAGDGWALLLFSALCLLPFLGVVFLFSARYRQIVSGLSSHRSRGNYRLVQVEASGLFQALLQKELRRYFGCPVYVANTMFGTAALLVGGIAALLFSADVRIVLAQLQLEEAAPVLLLISAVFMLSITCTTNVCISLEGKNLWILKEAPVEAKTIFLSKIALQLLVVWPGLLVAGICAAMPFRLSVVHTVLLLLTCFLYSLGNALWGLLINLLLPKMDCENDTVIVKQSASVMVTSLGGMLIAVVIGAICWFTRSWVSFPVQSGILILLSAAAAAVCWTWILRRGAQRLLAI